MTNKVKDYFNERAQNWISDPDGAKAILANFNINGEILDIGCGTGVLANLLKADSIDISENMIETAKANFPNTNFICEDIYNYYPNKKYDWVIMYNVYPHLHNKEKLVIKVHSLLKPQGKFLVAHGASKEQINNHHEAIAKQVSVPLKSAIEESKIWESKFKITDLRDDNLYYFSGLAR